MELSGRYYIAGLCFEIRSLFRYIHEICREYAVAFAPPGEIYVISTTPADIRSERERAAREAIYEGKAVLEYEDCYLETLAVYRKIADILPGRGRLLFHGSALAVDGEGCVFTAKSGIGKSTHSAIWRRVFGERVTMVNDDKPIIGLEGGRATVYGTPWTGKHGLGAPISAPLRAICFIERAPENSVTRLDGGALYKLLGQTYRPQNAPALKQTLELLSGLCDAVRLYRLRCNMSDDAARVSYGGIFG